MNNHDGTKVAERNDALALMICAGCVVWALSIPVLSLFYELPDSAAGFGSMFGAVNALFSGMALAGVVYTIRIQHQETQTSQRQMAESIKASGLTAQAMAYRALLHDCESRLVRYDDWAKQSGEDEKTVEFINKRRKAVHAEARTYRAGLKVVTATLHREGLANQGA